jgi:hypothetical protein
MEQVGTWPRGPMVETIEQKSGISAAPSAIALCRQS